MKRWTVAVLLAASLSASAQSYWDGSAALLRGDEVFESGAYAASNAFSNGTEVVVEDLDSGRTVQARVVQRIEGRSDLLIMLSPHAAAELELDQGELLRVRVTVRPAASAVDQSYAEELAAEEKQAAEEQLMGGQPPAAPGEVAVAEEPAAVEEVAAAEEPAAVEEEPAEEPAAVEIAAAEEAGPQEADALDALAARSPQKQLFLPPREDELFAYHEPAEEAPPEEAAQVAAAPEQPSGGTAIIDSINGTSVHATLQGEQPLELVEAQPPAEEIPEIDQVLAAELPEAVEPAFESFVEPILIAAGPEVSPESQGPAAAAAEPATPATVTVTPAAAQAAPLASLAALPSAGKPGVYYLQLAAYSDETQARDMMVQLAKTYPAVVLAPEPGAKRLYRVLLGPLNKAESGTLLNHFRYRGFPDAFVRTASAN